MTSPKGIRVVNLKYHNVMRSSDVQISEDPQTFVPLANVLM